MTGKYIVLMEGLTKREEKEFIEFLDEKNIAWWHRIPNTWLLVDKNRRINSDKLRDFLKFLAMDSSGACLVMKIEKYDGWSGYRRAGEDDTFDWLKRNWSNS